MSIFPREIDSFEIAKFSFNFHFVNSSKNLKKAALSLFVETIMQMNKLPFLVDIASVIILKMLVDLII